MIHEDMVDDEHYFSSPYGGLIRDDHPEFRGHAMGMHSRSQG